MHDDTTLLLGLDGVVVDRVELDPDGCRVVHLATAEDTAVVCPSCRTPSVSPKGWVTTRRSAKRPKRSAESAELERLRARNARLEAQLSTTRTALDIMGKAHALLEQLSESADGQELPRPPKK